MGRRDVHFGPLLRHDPGRVNKIATDVLVCTECGHLEFFHLRIGADLRADNPPLDINSVHSAPQDEEETPVG